MRRVLLLNGPNLDMLGVREPEVYGHATLADLEEMVVGYALSRDVVVSCFQSNSEAELVDKIHRAGGFDGIVYNPGAHTHYSYALRDAVAAIDVPVVEVHISNVSKREAFRNVSVIAPVCVAQVKGLGLEGYCRAIDVLCCRDRFCRLGEGYEARFPEDQLIIIAGEEAASELLPGSFEVNADSDSMRPHQPQCLEQQPHQPEDFTAPFTQAIVSEERGPVSAERQSLVRATCDQFGLDALLVRDTSNIRWLTALDGVFDEERAHALLVMRGLCALHTDSRYSNAIRTAAREIASDVVVNDERTTHAQFAREFLAPDGNTFSGKLGIEDTITYAEFAKMADAFDIRALSATTDVVRGLRTVKTRPEINRMLAAQAVTDAAFAHIVQFMRPGMTEREVQLELEGYMLRHGAEGLAFSSIVATGANSADPHAIPGNDRLAAGQCVVLDFGAKAYGYCSDMTRVVFLGQPDAKVAAAWEVLRRANETVEMSLRPGMTGKEAHELAERVLADGGFAGKMGHGLGHGVGLDVHELPVLNARNELPLVAGNVVTVEPGIYLPGEFGMRLEDCGVVTERGYEPFSRIGHDMVVL